MLGSAWVPHEERLGKAHVHSPSMSNLSEMADLEAPAASRHDEPARMQLLGDSLASARAALRTTESVVTKRDGSRSVQRLADGSETVLGALPSAETKDEPAEAAIKAVVRGARWSPAPALPIASVLAFAEGGRMPETVPGGSTLLVLDFDCTLAAKHMYWALRSLKGRKEREADEKAFFVETAFGQGEKPGASRSLWGLRRCSHTPGRAWRSAFEARSGSRALRG